MTTAKERLVEIIRQQPDDSSLEEIVREVWRRSSEFAAPTLLKSNESSVKSSPTINTVVSSRDSST